jgi:hypothetical protein
VIAERDSGNLFWEVGPLVKAENAEAAAEIVGTNVIRGDFIAHVENTEGRAVFVPFLHKGSGLLNVGALDDEDRGISRWRMLGADRLYYESAWSPEEFLEPSALIELRYVELLVRQSDETGTMWIHILFGPRGCYG